MGSPLQPVVSAFFAVVLAGALTAAEGHDPSLYAGANSCRMCHREKYKSKAVMMDRDRCIEKGMIYPATESCVLPHNDESPSWDPERYTTKDGKKVGFDVEQAYGRIKHPVPAEHKT
ncbi:MAG: hypothetical protein QGH42_10135 [Kiritimatiellia bacterium]|jgi:hypothetical protein|nr:hypothetical protein [Kiritimatiellia bacterium]MDP6630089.1 hypothetical protein [Kiritimatiellia bacterium]MDP6811248.1 hypothetical protein [Kiritimatiellia bacterium]MDP7024579.1 hypothetical protein [Kiritimatiellia bacterium]